MNSDNRIQITRVVNAPRAVVFGWWADAEKLRQWSGCKEAVSCEVTMDFRVGGSFTQAMQLAVNGGTCQFSIRGTYEEIAVPERIVYQAIMGTIPTRVTVEFFELGDATRVVVVQEGLPDQFVRDNVSRGTAESFDRLDSLLAARGAVGIL